MKDIITEYLSMKEIQSLTNQGIEPIFTGWRENNGLAYIYEVRYIPAQEQLKKLHSCRIFDLAKTGDEKYQCQACRKKHNQTAFNKIKNAAPEKFCGCGGNTKKMAIHIPYPVSGWQTSPIFYACNSCGNKYMFYRSRCQNECCGNTCDRSEVYCYQCQNRADKA